MLVSHSVVGGLYVVTEHVAVVVIQRDRQQVGSPDSVLAGAPLDLVIDDGGETSTRIMLQPCRL